MQGQYPFIRLLKPYEFGRKTYKFVKMYADNQ